MSHDVRVRSRALAAAFAAVLAAALGPVSAGARDGLIVLAQLPPTPAEIPPDDPLTEVERPVEDELILQMRLGRLILSDGFLGYLHRGGVLLPIGELAAALDFAIVVDPAAGQAEGWFLDESRTFFLDLARGEVVIEGRREGLARGLAEVHFDDIYVDTTLLARWFPVDLEFDLSRLVVTVVSREPLPIEERLAREQARAGLGRGAAVRPVYPRLETPHGLFDMPFIDLNTATDYDSVTETTASSYTALVTGDLLFMDANLFLSGTDEERLDDARFTIGRTDPDGALLGPLGVSEFSLGDVFTPQLPLVASQTEGRGASVSTFPLSRPSEFDRTTLRGELPLGWEVELFRNQFLIDSQRSRGDARYEFVDVPLLFGLNVLQLVFFGPQGQRREEVQRFFIGTELIRPGEQYWRVAANQQGTDTIQLSNDESSGDGPEGEERYLAEYERGITQNLSLAAGFASIPLEDGRHTYGSLGLSTSLLGALWHLDAAVDAAGGTALEGSVRTNILGVSLFAEHGQFFDFTSERVDGGDDALVSRTNVRVNATIPSGILPRIPVSFDGELERRESGRWVADLSARSFVFFGGVSASNSTSYSISGGGGTETTTSASGSLLFNSRIDNLVLRGNLDYTIEPLAELTGLSVSADRYFDNNFATSLDVTHSLIGERTTTVSPAVSGDFGGFAIGIGGTYVDDGTYTLGLTLSVGIGREPRSGSFALRPGGMAGSGAASARAFLDRNQNGAFDEGDEPLPGVRMARQRDVETDDDGLVFLTGLSSYQPTNIAIDVGSLEDPYWVPVREGVEIVPRPGKTVIVDFPVTATGEVDGTVFLRRGDELREVANVQLQLVDAGGNVAKAVKSEFDGFYLFDLVPPGRYLLRIAPEQVERLKLRAPPAREIAIEADGNIVSGIDLVLERARD